MESGMQENGLTVGELCRVIGKKIWMILAATVLFTVAVVLVFTFAINPLRASYSMQFRIIYPMSDDEKYPDGARFYYQDIVTASFLEEAKASDARFANVNIAQMIKNDDISIEAEMVTVDEVVEYTGRYTLTVRGSYFSRRSDIEDFIQAAANVPAARIQRTAASVDYRLDEEIFGAAQFEERLHLLEEEKEALLEIYDSWIDYYSGTYRITIEGKGESMLKDLRAEVESLYGDSIQSELETLLQIGGYYNGDLATRKDELKTEYIQNKTEIERLENALGVEKEAASLRRNAAKPASASSDSKEKEDKGGDTNIVIPTPDPDLSQRLAALYERNNRILHWLGSEYLGESGDVQPMLTQENNDKFAARLKTEYDKLNGAAETLRKATVAIYRDSSARFDMQTAEQDGTMSIIIVAVASFLLAFIVGCVVVCMIRLPKYRAGRRAAEDGKEASSETE